MNFQPQLAEKVMAGEKTVTRRLASTNPRSPWSYKHCGVQIGRTYAICPGRGKPQLGRVLIVSVRRELLGWLSYREARLEGFADADAFTDAWVAINGSYDESALVWRIEFEVGT